MKESEAWRKLAEYLYERWRGRDELFIVNYLCNTLQSPWREDADFVYTIPDDIRDAMVKRIEKDIQRDISKDWSTGSTYGPSSENAGLRVALCLDFAEIAAAEGK